MGEGVIGATGGDIPTNPSSNRIFQAQEITAHSSGEPQASDRCPHSLNVVSIVCRREEQEPSLPCIVSSVENDCVALWFPAPTTAQAARPQLMPDQKLLSLATALRLRAEEVLAHAEEMKHEDTQRRMRGVAATYEKLAQGLEQHAGDLDEM